MAARLGPSATISCEPRQAWKGAAVAVDSGAGIRLASRHLNAIVVITWERCPRGRRSALGKRVWAETHRGFESLPLRHTVQI